jgi:sulfur carrier protein
MTPSTLSTHDTIELLLDGRPHAVQAGTTLAELVTQLGRAPADVGTAVNGVFVPRTARAEHALAAGDAVLLFQPIVGG